MIGEFDIEIAKRVWREKIANERKAEFEKNDLAIRDAQLSGNKKQLAAAIARRDELRSLGDMIDAATSVEELTKIKPL